MNAIPNITTEVSNGQVSIVFKTKTNKCVLTFSGQLFTITVDGTVVFETGKQ